MAQDGKLPTEGLPGSFSRITELLIEFLQDELLRLCRMPCQPQILDHRRLCVRELDADSSQVRQPPYRVIQCLTDLDGALFPWLVHGLCQVKHGFCRLWKYFLADG